MSYYLVTAKCGHVGRQRYIPITFAITADNGKEAAKITRNIARVKHDHKDAILNVVKVSKEVYLNQMVENESDPYLGFKSRYQQNKYKEEIMSRTLLDSHCIKKTYKNKRDSVAYRLKKNDLIEKSYARQ